MQARISNILYLATDLDSKAFEASGGKEHSEEATKLRDSAAQLLAMDLIGPVES